MDGEKKSRNLPQWFLTLVIGRKPKWTLVRLAVLLSAAWAVFNYVLTPPIRVTGISMEPTYLNGQINFVNRLAYWRHDPQRGDVIGIRFKNTEGNSVMFLKRIVALPGETIAFVDGRLYINNEPVEEPYVKSGCNWNMPSLKLGFDQYYVVGDNRGMAFVDHWHRTVLRQQIMGRVLFRGSS